MNTFLCPAAILLGLAGMLTSTAVFAQDEDEEAADLQSFSVGDRRPSIDPEKITIDRPKIQNTFKLEAPKPGLSGIKLAKPKLEVLASPEPAPAPTRTADAAGASPSITPSTGETRTVQPLRMEPPQYPRDAYRRRQEGFVIVEFTINANGETEDISVVDAQPRGAFDAEARRAVARWTFRPALQNGQPVPQRIRHTLEFSLNGR